MGPLLNPRDKVLNIAAIGDSLTKGTGDASRKGYPGYVREALLKVGYRRVNLVNFGEVGVTSEGLQNQLQRPWKEFFVTIQKADVIFMTVGANDLVDSVDGMNVSVNPVKIIRAENNCRKNLRHIFQLLREHNPAARIVIVGLYNPFPQNIYDDLIRSFIEQWNRTMRKVTGQFPNTNFVRTYDLFANEYKNVFLADGFHPNAKGYQLIAARIMESNIFANMQMP